MSTLKTSLVVLLILIVGITAASASISVNKNIAITPVGELVSNQTPPILVTAIFTINFNPIGVETFPSGDTLTMSTDLENGQWSYITSLDGNPNPAVTANGRNVNINGWGLSYPSKRELSMKVTLNGEVPTVTASGNKTIIRVAELSSNPEPVFDRSWERYVIIPEPIIERPPMKIALADFRALIDEKAQAGIDTTAAMEKYSAANTAISNAGKSSAYSAKQTYLTNAQVLLKDGQAALDRAIVQPVINEAQTLIDQTDGLITYFKVDRSMGNDPRLVPIIQKRDRAADLLSEAKDLLPKNDFTGAKDRVLLSSDMAKQSYDAALALRKEIGDPQWDPVEWLAGIFGGLGSILIYIAIIAVIAVVVVVGIVLYSRRRTDWDELG